VRSPAKVGQRLSLKSSHRRVTLRSSHRREETGTHSIQEIERPRYIGPPKRK